MRVDVLVVGAGPAGLAVAVHAARAGADVLVLEKDARTGGTLHLSGGHLAAAGTAAQASAGIVDSTSAHLADIDRISRGTARVDLVTQVVHGAAGTVAWLESHGFAAAPGTPRIVYGHEPYRTARTLYGASEGLSILAALEHDLAEAAQQHQVQVRTHSPVTELIVEDGRVVGVEAWWDGQEHQVHASAVVLATGGYGADPELFAELEGAPLVSAAARTSTGDGLHLAQAVGAGLQGAGTHLPTFGGLPDPVTPGRASWHDRQQLTSERPPVEIYVDAAGERWVAEDEVSIDEKERALAGVRDQTFWTVFDSVGLDASRTGPSILVGRSADDLAALANTRPGVHAADSLSDLAALAGIDPAGLVATVGAYNEGVALGRDVLGRTHLPSPIARGPFYAIRNHAVTLVTFQGVDIDPSCRVRDTEGEVIDSLFAVGEVIGAGATCGNSFCSGMLLTPALTLGRLLGTRLATDLATDLAT